MSMKFSFNLNVKLNLKHKLFILLALQIISALNCSNTDTITRTYHFNLEDDLKTRYTPLISQKKEFITEYIDNIKKAVPQKDIQAIYSQFENINKSQSNENKEWIETMQVISEIIDYDVKDVFLCNLAYEIFCTSIIINTSSEVFMGRNLDFRFQEYFSKLAYQGRYYKDGELQFITQGFAGYVGALNGTKPGKFSLSLNERFINKIKNLDTLLKGYTNPAYLLFRVLNNSTSFSQSKNILSNTTVSSPVYFNLAGVNKNEGVIIVRNLDSVAGEERLDVDNGKWFIVQTNSDREKKHDERRVTAENRLNEIGRDKIAYENLMNKVMMVSPTKNNQTIYSTVQSPFNGGYLKSKYYEFSKGNIKFLSESE